MENPRGWFGQSRRHAAAARKGWRRRNPMELAEPNPRVRGYYRRARRRNPEELAEFDNPRVRGYFRRAPRRRRRNPEENAGAMAGMKKRMYGVGLPEVLGGLAGISSSSILPSLLIKEAEGETLTTQQKLLRIAVALGITVGIGTIGRTFMGVQTGRAAVIGGLIGMTSQAVTAFTDYELFGVAHPRSRVSAPRVIRQLPASGVARPAMSFIRGSETQAMPSAGEDVIFSVT